MNDGAVVANYRSLATGFCQDCDLAKNVEDTHVGISGGMCDGVLQEERGKGEQDGQECYEYYTQASCSVAQFVFHCAVLPCVYL